MTCLLDTNVISDDVKPQPDSAVCEWLDANGDVCGIPAPVLAEIADGIHAQRGARRDALLARLDLLLAERDGQFVSWDAMAAVEWGRQQHSAAVKRQPQSLWDSLSEAVALSRVAGDCDAKHRRLPGSEDNQPVARAGTRVSIVSRNSPPTPSKSQDRIMITCR